MAAGGGLDDYLAAIDYLVDMVGVDHVAVGTDFCQEQPRAWFEWTFSSQGTLPAPDVGYTPHRTATCAGWKALASSAPSPPAC
jgi:microsomal dipeptidase-like Zn-dependent dipeptidase